MNPAQLNKIIRQLTGVKSGLFAIQSEEAFYLRRIYQQVKGAHGDPAKDSLSVKRLYADELALDQVLEGLQTLPLLASKIVTYLFGLEKVSAADLAKLEPAIFCADQSGLLFIFLSKVDKRKKFFQRLLKEAELFQFPATDRQQLALYAKAFAEEWEKTIERAALEHLLEVLPDDLLNLQNEIAKLALAAGKQSKITVALAEELVGGSHLENIFAIADELAAKDAKPVHSLLTKILVRGAEGFVLNGILARHFRALRLARSAHAKQQATAALKEVFNINPYFAARYLEQSRAFDEAALDSAVELFYQNDRRLKTGADARQVFGETVAKLCRADLAGGQR